MSPVRRLRHPAAGLASALALGVVAGAACGLRPEPQAIDRLKPCASDEGPTDAYCGTLTVFENRETRQGRTIDLKIVVLPALGNDAAPDPLFFLAGGPGQGAAKMARQVRDLFGRIQARRDIVLVDQRGTGESNGLECRSDDDSLASINESDEAGLEQRVQCGWHRATHRKEDPTRSGPYRVDYTFTPEDCHPLEVGEWIHFRVPIYPVTHVFRAGSRLRLAISTPGRDHPFWCFDAPVTEGASHDVGYGGVHASSLVLAVWPDGVDHPDDLPPAGSLRGMPVRPIEPVRNTASAR